jgi:phage gpG-like protein
VAITVHYNVEGIEPVAHKLMAFAAKALEPAPALELVAEELRKIEAALFDEQGHGAWPPLATSTVERKGSDVIGIDSEAMKRSLTEEGAEGATAVILGDELIFGTALTNDEGFPYPKVFNDGRSRNGHQPPRPLFKIRPEDLRMISKGIQAYLVGVDRALFGLNRGGDMVAGSDLMPRF